MNIIFASYGNDSCALIQWAHGQQLKDVYVCYSNTGWAADWWSERVAKGEEWVRSLGFTPVQTQSKGMRQLVRDKKAWPRGGGGKFQFCTEHLKKRPALEWMEAIDPEAEALCYIGIRREESANRRTHPEWIEESEAHGGRDVRAPLVRHTESERNELLAKTPFEPLPTRSKECWPCVNAGNRELKLLDESRIKLIEEIEEEMGTNSKGNERVMFSPRRHGDCVGIRAVVDYAQRGMDDMFGSCGSGYCE